MDARPVVEGIQWVGAVDWDRRLFDELIQGALPVGHRVVRLGRQSRRAAQRHDPEPQGGGDPAGALQGRAQGGRPRCPGQAGRGHRWQARDALI